MADSPDPTRRLRPLLEARAGRARSAAPGALREGVDGRPDGRLDDRPGGAVGGRQASPSAVAVPQVAAAGWIPVWAAGDADPGRRLPSAETVRTPGGRHRPATTGVRGDDDFGPAGGRDRDDGTGRGRGVRRGRGAGPDVGAARQVGGRGVNGTDRSDGDRTGRGDGAGNAADAAADVAGRSVREEQDGGAGHWSMGRSADTPEGDDDRDSDDDDRDSDTETPWPGDRPGLLRGRRPWARWRERWVPTGPGVRVDPGRRGSALLSVIAIGAVVAAALGMFGSGGTAVGPSTVAVVDGRTSAVAMPQSATAQAGQPVSSVTPTAVSATSASGGAAASAAPTELIVAVTGAVVRPGIVTLSPGARVADAIAAAGGVLDGTDYTGLNLAARVVDGDSVVVGGSGQGIRSDGPSGETVDPTTGGSPDGPLDLNAADLTDLEALPGVGPVMAGNIVAWRDANGGFTAVDQLQEITGIGPTRFATLAPLVRVG